MKMPLAKSFAAIITIGSLTFPAMAVEDPHAAHSAAGGQPPASAGGHGGGMHEMMRQHMQALMDQGVDKHKGYADVVLHYMNELKLSDEQIGKITRIHQANQQKIGQLGPKLRES